MNAARGLVLVLPLVLAGCVTFAWGRDRSQAPPPKGSVEKLEPGRSTLADCLEALGAPLYVWEYKGDGAALAWGWADDERNGAALSLPLYEQASVSFSYDSNREKLRGYVLLFDRELVLELVREGWLRNLARDFGPRRPAPVPATD